MYNLGLSFALPALYGCSFLLRLPEKDFLKLIVTPKYFLTYCFVEHEVRSGILLWVLLIHFQTSMYLQGLNNVLSPKRMQTYWFGFQHRPRPLKQNQFENLLSMLRDTSWHFFLLSLLLCCISFGGIRKRAQKKSLGSCNQERND